MSENVPAIVHGHEKVRNYQNMNHIVKRIGILTGVFAAALCAFFLANNRWNSGQDQAVYMDMEAASLPSITVQMLGRDMNRLYGYRQEMNTTAAGENLTILPEDRALTVDITGGGVTGISYEVRSMDRARLVERTEVSDWQQTQQGIAATLPIQNLLTIMALCITTPGSSGQILRSMPGIWLIWQQIFPSRPLIMSRPKA